MDAGILQSAPAETVNEFLCRKQVIQRAFLIQLARAVDQCVRTQYHFVPVTGDVLEFPQHRRDGLVAHLLRNGDPVAFYLSIGMIRTDPDQHPALPAARPTTTPAPAHAPPAAP